MISEDEKALSIAGKRESFLALASFVSAPGVVLDPRTSTIVEDAMADSTSTNDTGSPFADAVTICVRPILMKRVD